MNWADVRASNEVAAEPSDCQIASRRRSWESARTDRSRVVKLLATAIQALFKSRKRMVLWILALGAGAAILDYVSGPKIQAPIAIAIPVILASWHGFRRTGLGLATIPPLVRLLADVTLWHSGTVLPVASANAFTRIVVLVSLAMLAYRAGMAHEMRKHIKILEGFLPICAFCKRIRNGDNSWQPLESYISRHSEAKFSHGFCPECARKHYGNLLDEESRN